MKIPLSILLFILLLITTTLSVISQQNNQSKTGILLVSFGTSYTEAQKTLDHIDEKVKEAFPGKEVCWAFTSAMIRAKLKKQGKQIDSPAEALAKMGSEGFTHIAVQSLHVIPGKEYEDLKETVEAFKLIPKNAKSILLGKPLLYMQKDLTRVAETLDSIVLINKKNNDAVLWMGHGTHHPSDMYYAAMQYHLWQKSPLYFMATIEGIPSLKEVFPKLKANKVNTVWLMPFMTVAGDHAQNDMSGNETDSWESQLKKSGYEVKIIMKGLAEYDPFVNIWINHLKETINELEK
jgi:sirohydrochlorin cobaltochelatase